MKKYYPTVETIIAFIVLAVVVFFMGRLKYYQYLGTNRPAEVRQEK